MNVLPKHIQVLDPKINTFLEQKIMFTEPENYRPDINIFLIFCQQNLIVFFCYYV